MLQPTRLHRRIEICGGIAAGKTTLCRKIAPFLKRVEFEDFQKNPFWRLFYQDADLHAFETEITFLLQHYSQIKTFGDMSSSVAVDYSFLQDKAYARVNLSGRRLEAFEAVYRYIMEEILPPVLIVHVQCSPGEELKRIQGRARTEEKSIGIAYLDALNRAIALAVDEIRMSIQVVEIDSAALDFAHNPEAERRVVSDVLAAGRVLPARNGR